VYSLYLDSPDLLTFAATLQGKRNRFKLRLRFYEDTPDAPVFFEIKRRENDVILKQRACVHRASVPNLLAGHWPSRSDLVKDDDKNFKAIYNFCCLQKQINAGPAAYTAYLREAYWSPGSDNLRVTFDRRLLGGEFCDKLSVANLDEWAEPKVDGVVLELKFSDRFPHWMRVLTQTYNLQRTSMPKYIDCLEAVRAKNHSVDLQRFLIR
jgi:SPX domain protein involved in polyphosphate accumulation